MDPDHRYMYPPVFLVDRSGMQSFPAREPSMVPCWSFPPARAKIKKGHGQACTVTVLLLILLLVFAALGLGTYQILELQTQLAQLRQDMNAKSEGPTAHKLQDHRGTDPGDRTPRQAAHLTVQVHLDTQSKTLHWEPTHGRAFTQGVSYRDGGLEVKEKALYFVYSRVEYVTKECPAKESLVHTLFKRSPKDSRPLVLLKGTREGYCQKDQMGYWSSSSYMGAVLQLDEQDRVFVNVSRPTLLSHNYDGNFFGIFRI